nr:G protein-coupled receptor [Proales similis]
MDLLTIIFKEWEFNLITETNLLVNVSINSSNIFNLTIENMFNTSFQAQHERDFCSKEVSAIFRQASESCTLILQLLGISNLIVTIIGIILNILNLLVLFNSKLNESPYTYLTALAFSDLAALSMYAFEFVRSKLKQTTLLKGIQVFLVTPSINIFLSSSMYITLALTIERFIFVHLPFRAMSLCRRSIARKVCLTVFIFSLLRYLYLPFMYSTNCAMGLSQKKLKALDIYEFFVSLVLPYSVIFVTNICLILSLNRQNSSMMTSSESGLQRLATVESDSKILRKPEFTRSFSWLRGATQTENNLGGPSTSALISSSSHSTRTNRSTPSFNSIRSTRTKYTKFMGQRSSNQRELKNQRKLTITLITILCLLSVCYLPSFLLEEAFADALFGSHDDPHNPASITAFKIKVIGYRLSALLINLNCSANFLIYCLCNKKFKNALNLLLKRSFIYNLVQYMRQLNLFRFKHESNRGNSQQINHIELNPV